jgi:hypothetical protein
MMRTARQLIAGLLLVSLTSLTFTHSAHAGMIPTDQAAAAAQADTQRALVMASLNRPEVLSRLQQLGVDPVEAQARVAALSDTEVAELAGRIEQLPSGGDSLIGALVFIFVVLLVTDILGLTKIFPFTRSVR